MANETGNGEATDYTLDAAERAERKAWQRLSDILERLTGESLDDRNTERQYCAIVPLLRVWAERAAIFSRVNSTESPVASIKIEMRADERQAHAQLDRFIDRIADENWSKRLEPETERTLLLTAAADSWGLAMLRLRRAQGTDGDRWGLNVLQYESAKLQRMEVDEAC